MQSTRLAIVVALAIIIIAAGFVFITQSDHKFLSSQVDGATVTNRKGQVMTLSSSEAVDLAVSLADAHERESINRMKTVFPNEINFYQAGDRTLTINAAKVEMFTPGKMQVIKPGLSRQQALPVPDQFYVILQKIADQHRFDIATD